MIKKEPILNSKDKRFRSFLIKILRQASYLWAPRSNALKAARVGYGKYECAECKTITSRKEIAIDHIEPVIKVEGFDSWNEVIDRMFCEEDGFQILCHSCHKEKSMEELQHRKRNRSK